MRNEDIFDSIVEMCRLVFDDNELELSLDSDSESVDQWDSLSHIQLILEIEKKFGLKFSITELQDLKKIRRIVELIDEKIK